MEALPWARSADDAELGVYGHQTAALRPRSHPGPEGVSPQPLATALAQSRPNCTVGFPGSFLPNYHHLSPSITTSHSSALTLTPVAASSAILAVDYSYLEHDILLDMLQDGV